MLIHSRKMTATAPHITSYPLRKVERERCQFCLSFFEKQDGWLCQGPVAAPALKWPISSSTQVAPRLTGTYSSCPPLCLGSLRTQGIPSRVHERCCFSPWPECPDSPCNFIKSCNHIPQTYFSPNSLFGGSRTFQIQSVLCLVFFLKIK